ncbi:helix-turn-helix domain-containing protein [Streptomyces aureoversilis]|uniref:Helix-turn-helix domain-containing protein n=1 Tax=Streptomyces aureoversilis TaxID=67277 RepID=A0ABV9ZRT7_9ACTN
MSSHASKPAPAPAAPVIPLRPAPARPSEPLWRNVVGDVLRRERLAQKRTLKDVADAGRISMPYLSEVERGRKEASSEVLAAAAKALGLSLAELLALVQAELIRLASRTHVRSVRSVGPVGQAAAPQPAPRRQSEVRLAA